MFDPQLRIIKDRLLEPVARKLGFVSPNMATLLGLVVGSGAAWAAWEARFGLGLALWVGNRVLDGLDGLIARIHGGRTDFGGVLDLVSDFVVYAAIPLTLALRPGAAPGLDRAAGLLLASFYVNAACWMVPAALLERRGSTTRRSGADATSIAMPEGLISGGETMLFYALFFLLPAQQVLLFHLMAALTALTALQRVVWARTVFANDSR